MSFSIRCSAASNRIASCRRNARTSQLRPHHAARTQRRAPQAPAAAAQEANDGMQLGSRPPQPAAAAVDAQAAADEAEAANAEEQSGGRPPEILEEFSNFTADLPGHKSGFVTIIGRPNAGKSTLMNALLHQTLSIVTPRAQTTRHRVLGLLSEPGYQAVFLDTPGIITDKRNKLEDKMMAAVQQAVKDADCLLAIIDASHKPEEALAMVQPGPQWKGPPMAILLNKTDLLSAEELAVLEAWFKQYSSADVVLPISAAEGKNLDAVVTWLQTKLPEGPSMYPKDIVSEQPERFFVSEIIRKHIFLQYFQEVPYGVAVEVTTFREVRPGSKGKGKDLIEAEIVIEKERQRGILIGKGGSALKQLGTAARAEVEEFLGRPVYLSLSVKVREGWRKDEQQVERLGY